MASEDPTVQARLEEGATLYESGKLYEALIAWKEVLEQDPSNEIAQEYLRFVEEEFQIGVDALLAHHHGQAAPPPPPPGAPAPPETSVPPPAEEALLDDALIDELFDSIAPGSGTPSRPPETSVNGSVMQSIETGVFEPAEIDEPWTTNAPPEAGAPSTMQTTGESDALSLDPAAAPTMDLPTAELADASPSDPVGAEQVTAKPVVADPGTADLAAAAGAVDPDAEEPPPAPMASAELISADASPRSGDQADDPTVDVPPVLHEPTPAPDSDMDDRAPPSRPSAPVRQRVSKVPVRRDSGAQPAKSATGQDSIEEMDWSEILEDGVDESVAPPEADDVTPDDEFFIEMGAERLDVEPGNEAAAWGASASSISAPAVPHLAAPTRDPFEMPASHFVDVPSAIFTDEPSVPDTWADDAALDLSDMSDDSIDIMLEADFQSWESEADDPFAQDSAEQDEWSNVAQSFDDDQAPDLPFAPPEGIAPVSTPVTPGSAPIAPLLTADQSAERPAPPVPFEAQDSFPDGASLLDDLLGPADSVEIPIPSMDEVRQARQTQQLASMPSKVDGFDAPPIPQDTPGSLPPLPGDQPTLLFDVDDSGPPEPPPAMDWLNPGFDPPSMELADPQEIGDVFGAPPEPVESAQPRNTQPGLGDPGSLLVETPAQVATAPTLDLPDTSSLRNRPLPEDPPLPGDPPADPPNEAAPAAILGRKRRGHGVEPGAVADVRRRTGPVVTEEPKISIDPAIEALLRAGLEDLEAIESDRPVGSESLEVRQRMPAPPPADIDLDGLMNQARQKQAAGDFSGSLALVEQVLAAQPNHPRAQAYLQENTDRLLSMYRSKLGSLTRMPRVKLRPEEIIWQALDHRAGFLLSQVDGRTSYEDLIEIAGMSEVEATRTLARLVDYELIG